MPTEKSMLLQKTACYPSETKQPDPIDLTVLNGVGWGTPAQQKATTVLDFDAIK